MTNILIVEDDRLTLDCLIDLLEAQDFQVTIATDGEIAQKIVTQKKFDLIVCDLLLPHVNGYEFLSYLRNNKKTADIPFIVLTGKSKTKDINLGWEMGVDDYLIKPFVNQDLIKSIRTQLEKRQFLEKCYQSKIQNRDRRVIKFASPANPTNQDNSTSKNNLVAQSILQDSLNKILHKYVTEKIESYSENNSNISKIAVCCLRLNNFEKIVANSTKHNAEILKIVAQRLIGSIGHQAKIVCLDNGDFAIIMPYIKNLHQAVTIVRTGQDYLLKSLILEPEIINLKSYVGISFDRDGKEDPKILIDRAQQLVAEAQKNRDDCYEVYSLDPAPALKFKSLVLVEELNEILSKKQLSTNYQPQIDLLTGKVIGYEALLHWHHPQRGSISPETFITIAEDAGLIKSIETKLMFDECQRLKMLHLKGFKRLKLAINVSPSQFHRDCFVALVNKILTKVQLEPQFLTIELTQSTVLKDKRKSITHLRGLKSIGVEVSLSNFAKNSSSLSYLKQFPFTILKVDLSYLNSLLKTSDSLAALQHITKAARLFNLQLVIEKVETKQQLNFLRQHHFAIAQGNYLVPPLKIDKFEYLLSGKSEWLTILFSFPPI